jgi:hypothetical protein
MKIKVTVAVEEILHRDIEVVVDAPAFIEAEARAEALVKARYEAGEIVLLSGDRTDNLVEEEYSDVARDWDSDHADYIVAADGTWRKGVKA